MDKFDINPEKKIIDKIKYYVRESRDNRLFNLDNDIIFEEPLVGFAAGKDKLFAEYKNIIGDFHLTPAEWLGKITQKFSESSVIVWVLPISEKTINSNKAKHRYPSKRWAHTRNYGEKFNNSLREYVVSLLEDKGYSAIAPMLSEDFSWEESSETGIASSWSERHAVYAAGLGTFGLCDGLITPQGKAMRCGSVITNLELKSSAREYEVHDQYCLFAQQGTCGRCIARCPGGAITEDGHNKRKCLEYQQRIIDPSRYGVEVAGCGLCQAGVPCESQIP